MDRITELLQERAKLFAQARAITEKAEKENRNVNDTEKDTYEKLLNECDELKTRADRAQKEVEIERELREVAPNSTVANLASGAQAAGQPENAHAKLFRTFLTQGEEAAKRENRDLSATVLTSGGSFVAPSEWVAQLIKFVDNQVFMRQEARVFTLNSAQSLGFPSLDTDPSDPAWTVEVPASAPTADTAMVTGGRELKPSPLIKLLKVSTTLLRNSAIPIEAFVNERLGYKVGVAEENAYMNGSGSGQPMGLYTASDKGISTGRDVICGTATTPTFDGLMDMKYSVKPQYWGRAKWIMHRLIQKLLVKIKDGNGQYIWRQGVAANEPDTILGHAVRLSEYSPSTIQVSAYVTMFGDLSNYFIADSLAMQIQRLVELYAGTRQVGFLLTKDTDGMPVLEEAFARGKLAAS